MALKAFILVCFILMARTSFSEDDRAIHPIPKEPRLIGNNLLLTFKKSISLPPTITSAAQKQDENQLRNFQKTRTENDCARAKSEVYVSLASFYGEPYGNLSKIEVDRLAPFFEQVRNDADYYIQLLKKEYPRQRPFLYIEGLIPCVPKEVSDAYPSGHSALARLYGLILMDMFPARKKVLAQRSEVIANDRVLSGMHHPSDIKAGKELGNVLYKEFKKTKIFQKLFKEHLDNKP